MSFSLDSEDPRSTSCESDRALTTMLKIEGHRIVNTSRYWKGSNDRSTYLVDYSDRTCRDGQEATDILCPLGELICAVNANGDRLVAFLKHHLTILRK